MNSAIEMLHANREGLVRLDNLLERRKPGPDFA